MLVQTTEQREQVREEKIQENDAAAACEACFKTHLINETSLTLSWSVCLVGYYVKQRNMFILTITENIRKNSLVIKVEYLLVGS